MGQQVQTIEEISEKQEEINAMMISKPFLISPVGNDANKDNNNKLKSISRIQITDGSFNELFQVKREVISRCNFILPDLQDDFLNRKTLYSNPKPKLIKLFSMF